MAEMLKTKVSMKLACPKHRRYNPADGPGAIRGGCLFCVRLWSLYQSAEELSRGARVFATDAADYQRQHEQA
jgi:hypothetical protein